MMQSHLTRAASRGSAASGASRSSNELPYLPTRRLPSSSFSQMLSINSVSGWRLNVKFTDQGVVNV